MLEPVDTPKRGRLTTRLVRDLTSGDLHYLINNSGVSYYSPILDLELSHVRNIFETNFMSLIAMTQAFFPLLRAAQGTVINNSSSAGVDAGYVPFGGAYGASKSAAAKLSQTLRVELAPFGVKVVTLYAGGIETGIWNSTAAYAELKSDSVCQPMKKEVEHIMSGAFMQNSPLDPFAEGVVAEITRYNPPRERWSGKLSSTVWWMNFLAPRWLIDYGFSDQSGLSLLKGRLEEQKKNS